MRPRHFFATHPVFTHEQFVAAHTASSRSANTSNSGLRKHVAAGRLLRARRGIYATVPRGADPEKFPVDPYLVATVLADDAAVAYHAALQFHGKAHSVSRRSTTSRACGLARSRFAGPSSCPCAPRPGFGRSPTSGEGSSSDTTPVEPCG